MFVDLSVLTGPTGAITSSADAMKVLRGYYDAFNKHDILAAVAFLAVDVKVKFPDSKKNWSSAAGMITHYISPTYLPTYLPTYGYCYF